MLHTNNIAFCDYAASFEQHGLTFYEEINFLDIPRIIMHFSLLRCS